MEGKRECYPWTPENVILFLAEENCRYLHFFFFTCVEGRQEERQGEEERGIIGCTVSWRSRIVVDPLVKDVLEIEDAEL